MKFKSKDVLKVMAGFVFLGCIITGSAYSQEKTFHFAHVFAPQENPYHNFVAKFKEVVKEKSEGRIEIVEHAAMELGSEREYIESCQMGTLDMAIVNASIMKTFTPCLDWTALYFVITNKEQAARVLKNERVQQKLEGLKEINLVPLSYISSGPRGTFTTKKSIKNMADLKDLKIRVMETPIHVAAWKAMGTNPTPMAYGELYTALEYGTVDGAENPISGYQGVKFYEPAPFFAFTNHQWNVAVAFMSKSAWGKLTSEEQEIFREAARLGLDYNLEKEVSEEEKHVKGLEQMGVKFTYPDIDEFKEKVIPALEKYEEEVGKEFVEMMRGM